MWVGEMWMTNEVGQRNILVSTILVPTSEVGFENGKRMSMQNPPRINGENNKRLCVFGSKQQVKICTRHDLKFMV